MEAVTISLTIINPNFNLTFRTSLLQKVTSAIVAEKKVCHTSLIRKPADALHTIGHYIQFCPANNDKSLDGKPRLKRTTGIPKSFLQTIDKSEVGNDRSGIMVMPDGTFVRSKPDR
jgi:hypothetical protein